MHIKLTGVLLLIGLFIATGCGAATSATQANAGSPTTPHASAKPTSADSPAPKLPTTGVTWFNSEPVTIKDLRGKVVLIDFWEYTCINCIRELPFEKKIYKRYKPFGFVILGVHAPEFNVAYNPKNLGRAVKRLQTPWPVVQDKNFSIWKSYNNHVWPSYALLDQEGNIVARFNAEGHDVQIERTIQQLLAGKNPKFDPAKFPIEPSQPIMAGGSMTHEMYVGKWHGRGVLQNEIGYGPGVRTFHAKHPPADGRFTLDGKWETSQNGATYRGTTQTPGVSASADMTASANSVPNKTSGQPESSKPIAHLTLRYHAREIYSVMNTAPIADKSVAIKKIQGGKIVLNTDAPAAAKTTPIKVYIKQDGKYLTKTNADVDVQFDKEGRSYIVVNEPRMYYLVLNDKNGSHLLTLIPAAPGLTINSFTFGNNATLDFDRL